MENVTLLPADRYVIFNKTILTDFDKKVLITFYEPIIGHLGVSLYLTLWNDLEGINQVSRELNHYNKRRKFRPIIGTRGRPKEQSNSTHPFM